NKSKPARSFKPSHRLSAAKEAVGRSLLVAGGRMLPNLKMPWPKHGNYWQVSCMNPGSKATRVAVRKLRSPSPRPSPLGRGRTQGQSSHELTPWEVLQPLFAKAEADPNDRGA